MGMNEGDLIRKCRGIVAEVLQPLDYWGYRPYVIGEPMGKWIREHEDLECMDYHQFEGISPSRIDLPDRGYILISLMSSEKVVVLEKVNPDCKIECIEIYIEFGFRNKLLSATKWLSQIISVFEEKGYKLSRREGNTIFFEGNNQFIRLKMHSNHAATIRMTTLEYIDNFDAYNTYAQFL